MTNDELKALYEKYPWAWNVEFFCWHVNRWIELPNPNVRYWPNSEHRLKPRLPADLPEPTEDMMNRAVYLGKNVKLPEGTRVLQGWRPVTPADDWTFCEAIVDPIRGRPYCIDINDPNADEIIALNRAEAKKPFDVEVETHPIAEMVQSVLNDRIQYLLSIDEQNIRDALIELGWTPPGESAWLRLDECEIQTADGLGGWDRLIPLRGERHLMALVYSIAKGGPASVRVRRKK